MFRALVLTALFFVSTAHASTAPPEREAEPSEAVLPTLAALVPGTLLHGAGPFVAGDHVAARRLLATEGIGLGLIALSGAPIVLTGASRTTIGPLYATLLTGIAFLGVSGLGNLYGGLSPAFLPGAPILVQPDLELTFGWQGIRDVRLGHTQQVALGLRSWVRQARIEGDARIGLDDANHRGRVGFAWRFFGPVGNPSDAGSASYLEVATSALYENRAAHEFSLWTGDVVGRGRLDLAWFGESLQGAFAELLLGLGLQTLVFDVDQDIATQLRMEAAFGFVHGGRGGPVRGETALFYDHRKDDYPGGFKTTFIVFGHVGVRTKLYFGQHWGLTAELATGGAQVARVMALYRFGELR